MVTVLLLNSRWSGYSAVVKLPLEWLQCCCYVAGAAKWNCCRLGISCVCIVQPRQQQWHFIWNHMPRVHACLAVTCHLHFWKRHKMVSRNRNFWRWTEMRQGINTICSPVWRLTTRPNQYMVISMLRTGIWPSLDGPMMVTNSGGKQTIDGPQKQICMTEYWEMNLIFSIYTVNCAKRAVFVQSMHVSILSRQRDAADAAAPEWWQWRSWCVWETSSCTEPCIFLYFI